MATAVEEVQNAILTHYGTHYPALREQANRALMAFQETREAWGVAVALLLPPAVSASAPPPLEVQYFVSSILHTKVTRDWAQLEEPGQVAALSKTLLQYLKQQQQQQQQQHRQHEHRLVLFRVCYTLTTLAVESTPSSSSSSFSSSPSGGITHLLDEAF